MPNLRACPFCGGPDILPRALADNELPSCGDCDPCLGGRPDQCALFPSPVKKPAEDCFRPDGKQTFPMPEEWLTAQRAVLAEARRRIIARYQHVETWLKQPAPENIIANWGGMVQGLREARMRIGGMWDELPVKNPNTPEVDEILGMDTIP